MSTMDQLAIALKTNPECIFGNGVTRAEVRAAELALGETFPDALSRYLEVFGRLEIDSWELYGLGEGTPAYLDIVNMTLVERDLVTGAGLPRGLIAIMNDGAGNLFCVDANPQTAGRVVFWDTRERVVEFVAADTLADWIAGRVEGKL